MPQIRLFSGAIRNRKEFTLGLLYAAVGAFFALTSLDYDFGTRIRIGPGYFPFWLGVILAGIGVAILLRSLSPETESARLPDFHIRGLIIVFGSLALFAALLKLLGAFFGVVLLVVLASVASHEFDLRKSLIWALIVAAFCAVLFVVLLDVQIPLWPSWI